MRLTGKLTIVGTESRLNGKLLARCDESNPIGSGTAFLKNKMLKDGDNIWVTGEDGTVGEDAVFCMDDAGRQMDALDLGEKRSLVSEVVSRSAGGSKSSNGKKTTSKAAKGAKGNQKRTKKGKK
jgi:hypothetical protein